jgi:2-polyprenyl-6-methoxyphenol hydroxylase-like FAD-dependent oxidoreductase
MTAPPTNSASPSAADPSPVLVIGAGPVGLTMASELRRHGIACRIVDKNEGTTDQSRALVVHARTLEAFADMGVVDEALDRGHRTHGASIYADGKRIIHVTLDDLETPYPFFLDLNQSDTESILEAHLGDLGGAVEWETEAVGLEPEDEGVRVRLVGPSGAEEEAAFRYVVACDGAHSFCRETLDLDFPGGIYPREFLLADVYVDWAHERDEWYAYLSEQGLFFAAPLKEEGRWRLITEREAADEARENGSAVREATEVTERDEPMLEDLRAAVEATVPVDIEVHDPVWMSYFRVHHRILDDLRAGRVFFCGDAAHLHTPLGGQGMNAGIQDAYNLAWKLALHLEGEAGETLLGSYNAERRPADAAVVENTDRLFRAVLWREPVPRALRDQAARLLTAFGPLRERLQSRMAMLTVDYRESPIVGEDRAGPLQSQGPGDAVRGMRRWNAFGAGPEPGDRAPDAYLADGDRLYDTLHGTDHVLLLFAGGDPEEDTYRRLARLADAVASDYGDLVRSSLVWPGDAPPAELSDEVPVLFDPDGDAHHRYGARADCLYLVRPDGYVGFRAQPARAEGLQSHLARLVERTSPVTH